MTPAIAWFQEKLGTQLQEINKNGKYVGTNKLAPRLMDHKNYVIHYRNLKFLVSLGVVITKVHKVLAFKQKAWLAPYIDGRVVIGSRTWQRPAGLEIQRHE
jgi:hypothetical protein